MSKEIKEENIIRIKDKALLENANKIYGEMRDIVYTSKNQFFVDMLRNGIQSFETQSKDRWELQHERQTLLDAIHEHTKRMNYFIKFSKPFIRSAYANGEITMQMLSILFNYYILKMDYIERKEFDKKYEGLKELPEDFEELEKQLREDYDNEVD